MGEMLLEMRGITKRFGAITALDQVDFSLGRGEVHALVGENGAGKSTLMKVLLGYHRADDGVIRFKGQEVSFHSPADALNAGISMIHQEVSLIPEMDVAENIWLGREKKFMHKGLIDVKQRYEVTRKLLQDLNIHLNVRSRIAELSIAEMQLVELCRALSYNPDLIIMDEPTSALSDVEIDNLYRIVRDVSSRGVSVIFVSHKLNEIYAICSKATILRDGRLICVQNTEDLSQEKLIEYIAGRKVEKLFERQPQQLGDIYLEVNHLNSDKVNNVHFSVRKGEIYGLAGLMGAGRTEILRAIYGIDQSSGEIKVGGKLIKNRTPAQAVRNRFGMVTEDRLRMGAIYSLSIMGNTTLSAFRSICNRFRFYRKNNEKAKFMETAGELSIKYGKPEDLITSLSGGNQQKCVFGRATMFHPNILLLDEPTRGIDVGAKNEIYQLIDQLSRQGMTIVMVSSELPELLSLCDRIGVVRDGEIVFECTQAEATQELLMSHAFN